MNRWLTILLALTVAPLFAESPTPPRAEPAVVSAEAGCGYSAPGDPETHRALR